VKVVRTASFGVQAAPSHLHPRKQRSGFFCPERERLRGKCDSQHLDQKEEEKENRPLKGLPPSRSWGRSF
jgi:hypothetical protein